MKKLETKNWMALGLALSLLGCAGPLSLMPPAHEAASDDGVRTLAEGAGSLTLGIRWPDAGSRVQAIPNRSVKAIVTLTRADGLPAVDTEGKPIPPVEIYRQQTDPYYGGGYTLSQSLRWDLPAQADLKVRAEMRDGNDVVASHDEQTLDVVPGVYAYLSMNLVAVDAPVLQTIDKTVLRFGEPFTLTGSGFGKQNGWKAQLQFLVEPKRLEGPGPGPLPGGYYYGPSWYLPESALAIASDHEMTVTLPAGLGAQGLLSSLMTYFLDREKYQLSLVLNVDGIRSKPLAVEFADGAEAKVSVDLVAGEHAPEQLPDRWHSLDFRQAPYSVPRTPGTRWKYLITTRGQYSSESGVTTYSSSHWSQLEFLGADGGGRTVEEYPGSNSAPYERRFGPGEDPYQLFYLYSENGVQSLPDATVDVPGLGARQARRFFAARRWETREVWLVDGVGIVKEIRTTIGDAAYDEEAYKRPRRWDRHDSTVELVEFETAAGAEE
jgi:hypothetical protein